MGPPCLARISFWRDPALTPTRMGMPRAPASRAISFTLSCFLMFPGLMRTPAQPASIAAIAYFHWKWMSATTGIVDLVAIAGRAAASSVSGTATRTMSQPDAASSAICWRVALMSAVLVMHIDCTLTGAPPPTGTLPTLSRRDRRRPLPAARSVISRGKATVHCSFQRRASAAGGAVTETIGLVSSERVGDRVGDVQPHHHQDEHEQQADRHRGDRRELAEVHLAPGDRLPADQREIAAVQDGYRQQVEDPDEDVELDQQRDEEGPLPRGHRLAHQPTETDHTYRTGLPSAGPARPAGRLGSGLPQPLGEPGREAADSLERADDQVTEHRPAGGDALDRSLAHQGAGRTDAEEAARLAVGVLLQRRHQAGGQRPAVALVG